MLVGRPDPGFGGRPGQAGYGVVQRVLLLVVLGWPVAVAVLHGRRRDDGRTG